MGLPEILEGPLRSPLRCTEMDIVAGCVELVERLVARVHSVRNLGSLCVPVQLLRLYLARIRMTLREHLWS